MSIKRKYKILSKSAYVLTFLLCYEMFFPAISLALTSGPSQPEFSSFEPATTTDMVDLFSGDFTYNIPLFELPGPNGGYPFNLAYHAGPSMEQDASWVGLGWDLNVGAVNRSMRGVPDEFKGEKVVKTQHTKPNVTVGVKFQPGDVEALGFKLFKLGSISAFYNSYKGIGYSVNFSLSFAFDIGKGASANMGLGVTMNTQQGVDIAPQLGLEMEHKVNDEKFKGSVGVGANLGANFNSLQGYQGMNYGVSPYSKVGRKEQVKTTDADGKDLIKTIVHKPVIAQMSFGGRFNTFSSASVVPTITDKTGGSAFDITFKFATNGIVFPSMALGGYYNEEHLKYNNTPEPIAALGYNNLGAAPDFKDAMLDFNREKDGAINKYTKALPIPSYTYDTWSVSGQGIGQSIRSHKNTISYVYDRYVNNTFGSGSFFFEIAPSPAYHGGGGGGGNMTFSKSGYWGVISERPNDHITEQSKNITFNGLEEPYYYRVNGDVSVYTSKQLEEYLGGFEPMRIILNKPDGGDFYPSNKFIDAKGNRIEPLTEKRSERALRSNLFMEVLNEQITGNENPLKEFDIETYDGVNNYNSKSLYNREEGSNKPQKSNHMAGFIATNADGLRYVYGLPVYNKKQVECAFSVNKPKGTEPEKLNNLPADIDQNTHKKYYTSVVGDMPKNTNKYLSKTEMPAYPHTYLLTSVIGNDYVDVLGDGVTEDDLGYWVKFNYAKASDFKWRMPFTGANFNIGMYSDNNDDKGSYMYGEREQYYLQSVETKTHIAIFELEARSDNGSALHQEYNDDNNFQSNTYRLKEIKLYSKEEYNKVTNERIPIKTIILHHNNSLCNGIENGSSGKLTLEQIEFKYRNSSRGENNKYKFEYGYNPPYASGNQDHWGTFSKRDDDFNTMFPYTKQATLKSTLDDEAAAWSLTKITMPSGAIINIDYEADDYSYVQNKEVMQLTQLCNASGTQSDELQLTNNKKLYFKFHSPISQGTYTNEQLAEKYLDGSGYVYYKVKAKLLQKDGKIEDFIGGYAELDKNTPIEWVNSTTGCINLAPLKTKDKPQGYDDHPICIAAWNYLQMNRPDLIGDPAAAFRDTDNPTKEQRRSIMMSLLNPFKGLGTFIKGFYNACRDRGYGRYIDTNYSYVRLNSNNERQEVYNGKSVDVTKFKYGGGLRVKQISIKENAGALDDETYGMAYSYLTKNDKGEYISSGVATFEPTIGGEENPLRQPLKYEVDVKMKTNYVLFTELPYNESLYPAASVGYSKVTVKSLVTDRVLTMNPIDNATFPSSTGVTEHCFYTAKDYPVISKATEIKKIASDKPRTINAFSYTESKNFYYGTQGFSIELNDMHGKPKSIEQFAMTKKGEVIAEPISGSYYYYHDEPAPTINNRIGAKHLVNSGFTTIKDNKEEIDQIMGIDFEVINDIREMVSKSGGLSMNVNVDGVLFIVIGTAFPMVNRTEEVVKTAVTNKIIYRSGMLKEVVQMTDGAEVSTKNLVYDYYTGTPVVQKVTNEFGDDIISNTHLAYWTYAAMGPAYKNIGAKFNMELIDEELSTDATYQGAEVNNPEVFNVLHAGDELLITDGNNNHYKGIIMKKKSSPDRVWVDIDGLNISTEGIYNCFVYRSGYRNQLNASIQQYSKLDKQ